jgi:hypothetical protein
VSKYHVGALLIGVVIGVIAAPKLRSLPGVSKLPSVG